MDRDVLLAEYWKFINNFKSKKIFSFGDARAYISALVDLNLLDIGLAKYSDFYEAMHLSLNHSNKINKNNNIQSDYSKILKKWRKSDKSKLIESSRTIKGGGTIPIDKKQKNGLSAISLCTGCYGLDLGFEYAGFKIKLGLDNDKSSEEIITKNRSDQPFILDDISKVKTEEILTQSGLQKGEIDVIIGGPPCQPFSPAGNIASMYDPRSRPLLEFIRVVREAEPKAFVMEEVPGLLSARIKHVPLREIINGRRLSEEEKRGSAWKLILKEIKKTNYEILYDKLNAADFGAPQTRERIIVVGINKKLGRKPELPEVTHKKPGKPSLQTLNPWVPVLDAIIGIDKGKCNSLGPKFSKYMPNVPPGGNWRQLPDSVKKDAMNSAYHSGGGKMGFYRRLSWFHPSPTLVTSPSMKSTMMIHPWEERPISVNEYKVLQGFPIDWNVPNSVSAQYRKIGEAVPPILAYAVAQKIKELISDG